MRFATFASAMKAMSCIRLASRLAALRSPALGGTLLPQQFIDIHLRADIQLCSLCRCAPPGSGQAPHAFDDEFDGGLPPCAGRTALDRSLEGVQRIDEPSCVIWVTHLVTLR